MVFRLVCEDDLVFLSIKVCFLSVVIVLLSDVGFAFLGLDSEVPRPLTILSYASVFELAFRGLLEDFAGIGFFMDFGGSATSDFGVWTLFCKVVLDCTEFISKFFA